MNKNEFVAKVAAVIGTLAETNGAPESTLYMFFDMNMDLWNEVRRILIDLKIIKISANFVTLTPKGLEQAQKINAKIGN